MKKTVFKQASKIICLILFIGIWISPEFLSAQGMTRSTGIGFRLNFWNITNKPTTVSVSAQSQTANIDISGAGGTLYFFSRVHDNLFFEINLEAVASVQTIATATAEESTKVNLVMPILLGLRYDLLSSRLTSKVQPYISFGGGPYWTQKGESDINGFTPDAEQTFEAEFLYGLYGGLGANILLTDWMALNLDLKYHMPELNVDHKYGGLDFGLGLSFMWGKKRELFQLQDITVVVSDIYPAYYQFYNTYPLAVVSIKNIAGHLIEVNVKSNIEYYSERPGESGFVEILPGETAKIPVTALFGSNVLQTSINKPALLDIEIEGRAGRTTTRQYSAQITIHSRNAWNGDMDKLVYFVTPDNDQIFMMNRSMISTSEDSSDSELDVVSKAKIVFNSLRDRGVSYHPDPNIPFNKDDRVQYALETLQFGSGDCDDLVVLYSSCLESLGIKTAFVEVQDPNKKIAHLYLLFDTGMTPDQGHMVSSNEKKYIIRSRRGSMKTIWVPVETTLIATNFDMAWKSGAQAYVEEGILRNGLASGWVRIFDVE